MDCNKSLVEKKRAWIEKSGYKTERHEKFFVILGTVSTKTDTLTSAFTVPFQAYHPFAKTKILN